MLWPQFEMWCVLWLLGVHSGAIGPLIHVLSIVALVEIVVQLTSGRRIGGPEP
jgi:hypothetical protein